MINWWILPARSTLRIGRLGKSIGEGSQSVDSLISVDSDVRADKSIASIENTVTCCKDEQVIEVMLLHLRQLK